jgi:hypothetical protein
VVTQSDIRSRRCFASAGRIEAQPERRREATSHYTAKLRALKRSEKQDVSSREDDYMDAKSQRVCFT